MLVYNISVYYTMGYPEDVPEDAKEFFKIFDETPGLKVKSTDDLVELLFQNTGFIALASFGAEEEMAFVAFEIMLEVKWLKIIDWIFKLLRLGQCSSSSSALQSALFPVLPESLACLQKR